MSFLEYSQEFKILGIHAIKGEGAGAGAGASRFKLGPFLYKETNVSSFC